MGVRVKQWKGAYWVFINHKGQRKARRVGTGREGKKAAEQAATKIAARLTEGGPLIVDAPATVPTFAGVAEAWLEWYPTLYALREPTLGNRAHFIKLHLIPFFGSRFITQITRSSVQDFIAAKRATGGSVRGKALADSTLKMNLPCLRLILDYAVEKGWLPSNPMRGVRLWRPTPQSVEPDPFTQRELSAILEAAEEVSVAFALMLRAWAQSGMRSGEIRGLQRGDLDPTTGKVVIQRTRSGKRIGPPKTGRSRREAILTFPVCENTTSWQPGATAEARKVLDRLAHVIPLDSQTPLFASVTEPMSPMDETELHRLWDRVIRRAKVRHRPPEVLRHTCISLLLSRGAPLLQVAQQTGHSPVVLLKFYAKWLPQGQPAATPAQPVLNALELTVDHGG
jgi:integrase